VKIRFGGERKVMVKLVEMDEKVTFSEQMEEKNVGPVILINKFNVKPEEVEHFLNAWEADATYFKQQPGFISAQLPAELVAAVCSSTMRFGNLLSCIRGPLRTVISAQLGNYPASTVASPHLFKKVAVPGICVN
jgi:hypothetical protein